MNLKNLKTDTVMQVINETTDQVYRATFYELINNDDFYVKSKELHAVARPGMQFRISYFFKENESICTFLGEVERVWIRSGAYLTLFKRITEIEETTQRKYQREQIAVKVTVYRMTKHEFENNEFIRELSRVVLSSVSFDISGGGLCLISNDRLVGETEGYFLTEFTLNKEQFFIPAKLVRAGNAPQMVNYRFDYGFEFAYDHLAGEETKLLGALLNSKMAWVQR